jgi:hydrogenase maturation protease
MTMTTDIATSTPSGGSGAPDCNCRLLVVGLGNLLLADDGVGVHAVRMLQEDPPPGVVVAEVGTALLDALYLLEQAEQVLAIDAMQAGGEPGTIYAFAPGDVLEDGRSLHDLGLVSILRFLPEDGRPRVAVLGVEPGVIEFGLELSTPVAAAMPSLLGHARHILHEWQAGRA